MMNIQYGVKILKENPMTEYKEPNFGFWYFVFYTIELIGWWILLSGMLAISINLLF